MKAAGYQVRTTDGVIGTSGTPKIIFAIHFLSGGSGGTVDVHDGTGTSGTKVLALVGTASETTSIDFGGEGVMFPSGCYLNVDANVSSVTVVYQEVR